MKAVVKQKQIFQKLNDAGITIVMVTHFFKRIKRSLAPLAEVTVRLFRRGGGNLWICLHHRRPRSSGDGQTRTLHKSM